MKQSTLEISQSAKIPLYHQIYLILRQKIVDGSYPFGSVLPSEFEIAHTYNVSRITAKRALNELSEDNLVNRERGKGTIVSYRHRPTPPDSSVEVLMENLLNMGFETQVQLLEFEFVQASPDVAALLDIETQDRVQRAIRVRHMDDNPFSFLTTYVPEDIGSKFSADDLTERPLLAILEANGVRVSAAKQTITATLADARVAHHLKIRAGDPLLNISRVVFDQDNRPVEYINALYRADLYQYRMNLNRNYSCGPSNTHVGSWAQQ